MDLDEVNFVLLQLAVLLIDGHTKKKATALSFGFPSNDREHFCWAKALADVNASMRKNQAHILI